MKKRIIKRKESYKGSFSADQGRGRRRRLRGEQDDFAENTPFEAPEEDLQGKTTYSDIFVIGKESRTDLSGCSSTTPERRAKIREIEDTLNRQRSISCNEFLVMYDTVQEVLGVNEEQPKKKRRRRRLSEKEKAEASIGSEPGERGPVIGLRVIGGQLRGTKLKYSGDHRVRPMKERVRESVFNLLGLEVKGKHVVDLFAGTGALTFEAISRGSESATMIEVHFPTARVIRENIALLEEKMPGVKQKIELITTDVFFFGKEKENILHRLPKKEWLVFCSPPYDFYVERHEELLDLIRNFRESAPAGSLFVIEADERFDFNLLEVPMLPRKRKSYPPAEIGMFVIEGK